MGKNRLSESEKTVTVMATHTVRIKNYALRNKLYSSHGGNKTHYYDITHIRVGCK